MNTPNPLVPQGTLPAKGKSNLFFKVLMVLTVHIVVIGGMLLQGCKDTKDNASNPPADSTATTSSADTLPPVTSTTAISNAVPTPPPAAPPIATTSAVSQVPPPLTPPVATPAVTAPAPPAATETTTVTIAAGDTLGAIAHKNGISLKVLMEANPNVNPKKLQVGQKIQVPAGAGAVATATTGVTTPDATGGDTTLYTVKSGDTLGKIARLNHTTYKKIMALNDLKTTSIKVGQKLKLPAKAAGTETPAASTTVAPLTPTPPASTAPTSSTTASN